MREKHLKVCSICKNENYMGNRNKSKNPNKTIVKKYCSRCNSSTDHTEKTKFK